MGRDVHAMDAHQTIISIERNNIEQLLHRATAPCTLTVHDLTAIVIHSNTFPTCMLMQKVFSRAVSTHYFEPFLCSRSHAKQCLYVSSTLLAIGCVLLRWGLVVVHLPPCLFELWVCILGSSSTFGLCAAMYGQAVKPTLNSEREWVAMTICEKLVCTFVC